jgi:hypothetical protein
MPDCNSGLDRAEAVVRPTLLELDGEPASSVGL